MQLVCDGNNDCGNEDDESNCSLSYQKFECFSTKKLIDGKQVCNHFKDCYDGSDENYCGEQIWKTVKFLKFFLKNS